jgi:hypothetical protein
MSWVNFAQTFTLSPFFRADRGLLKILFSWVWGGRRCGQIRGCDNWAPEATDDDSGFLWMIQRPYFIINSLGYE